VGVARNATRSDMTEEDMAALVRQAQEEQKLGQLVRCDTEGELRAFFAEIDAHQE
jgi:hypothetical protein